MGAHCNPVPDRAYGLRRGPFAGTCRFCAGASAFAETPPLPTARSPSLAPSLAGVFASRPPWLRRSHMPARVGALRFAAPAATGACTSPADAAQHPPEEGVARRWIPDGTAEQAPPSEDAEPIRGGGETGRRRRES
ncbi:MAG: hypothetical protein Kow00128_24130 [Deltaproteobacteria bacterium]